MEFDRKGVPRGGEFEPCLGGSGEFEPEVRILSSRIHVVVMEEFKGKEFSFVSEWLKSYGLQKLCNIFEDNFV